MNAGRESGLRLTLMQRQIEDIHGVVLDLDGTVYDDRGLIPGAAEAITALRSSGLGLRFATNTSRYARGTLIERLRRLGVDANLDEVMTAPRAAAAWLTDRGFVRISMHVAAPTLEEFSVFTITEQDPQVVVLGDIGDLWSVDRLNRVFRHVLGGAKLLAIHKNRYWQWRGELRLDAGPFVAALEYATGATAAVAGKPSRQFFLAAATSLAVAVSNILVVGDDVRSDVEGAQMAGARGALVRTGKFRDADVDDLELRPDLVLDSIADLPAALGV
jgi:phospholysine phosphohistidine inorganic pyrophosphate phosphatase